MILSEYELDQFCKRHPECDCNCMKCHAFIAHQREELGLNDYDND